MARSHSHAAAQTARGLSREIDGTDIEEEGRFKSDAARGIPI